MRGFLTVILFLIFFLTFPLAVFSFAVRPVLSSEYVKNRLSESKIYTVVAGELPELVEAQETSNGEDIVPDEIEEELKAFIKEEVTAEYLQAKIEPFVDDVFAWLSGETEEVASLSFADLNEKLDGSSVTYLLTDEADNALAEPIKFQPQYAEQLRSSFQFLKIVPIIFSVASLLVLLTVFLMARGWKSKLRKLSLALAIPAIFGLITASMVFGMGNLSVDFAAEEMRNSDFERFAESVSELFGQIPVDIASRAATIFGVALAVSLGFFIISFFFKKKADVVEKGSIVREEPKAAT
jgi:hypothetical protein